MGVNRFSAPPGEYRVYRAESEVFVGPRSTVARITNRTEWFDQRGRVTGREETEWVGPLTSLVDGTPPGCPEKKRSFIRSWTRPRIIAKNSAKARINRVADAAVVLTVLAAAATFLYFSIR